MLVTVSTNTSTISTCFIIQQTEHQFNTSLPNYLGQSIEPSRPSQLWSSINRYKTHTHRETNKNWDNDKHWSATKRAPTEANNILLFAFHTKNQNTPVQGLSQVTVINQEKKQEGGREWGRVETGREREKNKDWEKKKGCLFCVSLTKTVQISRKGINKKWTISGNRSN